MIQAVCLKKQPPINDEITYFETGNNLELTRGKDILILGPQFKFKQGLLPTMTPCLYI